MYVYYRVLLIRGTVAGLIVLDGLMLPARPHLVPIWPPHLDPVCGALARLGASWGVLGRLGASWGDLGAILEASGGAPGAVWGLNYLRTSPVCS